MNNNSQTGNNSSPKHTPNTGRSEEQEPSVVGIIPKQPSSPDADLIQDIKISDDEQGFTIEYEQSVQAQKVIEPLFQELEDEGITVRTKTSSKPQVHMLFLLESVHFPAGYPQEIHLQRVNPAQAYQLILDQLDKTNINSLKTSSMGAERESITKSVEQQREELAQRFVYEDVSRIPPGVDPLQLNFLRDAAIAGVFEKVAPLTQKMITEYFTTQVTYVDLGKVFGITDRAVNERIFTGLDKLRRVLYEQMPEFAQEDKYPLEQIKKGKKKSDIFKSERSKERRSNASIKGKYKKQQM